MVARADLPRKAFRIGLAVKNTVGHGQKAARHTDSGISGLRQAVGDAINGKDA